MKQLTIILAVFVVVAIAAVGAFIVDKPATVSPDKVNKDSLALAMHLTYHVKPEQVSDFKKAFNQCAVETRKESGCKAYDLYQSPQDSTEFFLFESWTNKDAHRKHVETSHLKEYSKKVTGMFQEGRNGKSEVVYVIP